MTIHLKRINGFGNGNGGGGGGGDVKFPTIVTSSGSSLPSASGYQDGDTFLNTSDKKIYKAGVSGYIQNTNVYSSGINVDLSTGIATGFTGINFIRRIMPNNSKEWSGTGVSYKVHFKATSFSGWNNNKFQAIFRSQSAYQNDDYSTVIAIQNKQMYLILGYTYGSGTKTGTKLFDYEILENTEYFFRITKNGTSAFAELFIGGYDGTLVASGTIETQDNIVSGSRQTYIRYGMNNEWSSSNVENFINGEVYLADSEGELLIPNPNLSWDSGTSITDKTEYADKTNGILYLYENDELVAINTPSSFSSITGNATDNTSLATALSSKKDKAETITISTASVTIANVQANKNYVLSSSALTDITLTACETSFEETSINFTTGSSAPTFTDNASIKWFGGVPEMKANTTYTIVIFNKQAYWQEQENV